MTGQGVPSSAILATVIAALSPAKPMPQALCKAFPQRGGPGAASQRCGQQAPMP